MRASWKPLIVGGAWNPELRKIAREASGVYVVRRIADGVVLYVGMSESGVMWKTLQRHFQAWKTLPDLYWSHDGKALVRGRESFQHGRPEMLEAALFVTSTGKRTKKEPDRRARDLEQSMIRRYRPTVNLDPGHAWDERGGAPVSRSRKPRAGSVAAARDEDVPDEEIENDAAEPDEVWEDTSDDPDDPFAARVNPAPEAHTMKRNPPIPEVPAASLVRYLRTRPNEPIHVFSYDGDRSFTLKEDGRHIARLIPSRELADWMRESLSAAKLDARLHDKLTELVGPPPGDGSEFGAWSLGGVYSNNEAELLRGRFVEDSNGDRYEQPEVAAWLESPALAQVVGALVEQGRKLRALGAASRESAAQARAVGASHGLRPGMRVRWTTDAGSSREAEHFGTVEALAKDNGAIILEDGRRKAGGKTVRDVSPPFRHDLNVRHSDVRQIAPGDDPRHKPTKSPKRQTFAAKRAELLEALRSRGWKVEENLKTPHATNRDGDRLWFRTQAIYFGSASGGERAARSLVSDMREVSAEDVERLALGAPAMPAPAARAPWQEVGANTPHTMFPRGAIDFVAYVDRSPMHALALDASPIGASHLYVKTATENGWIAKKGATSRFPMRYVVTAAGSRALGTFDSDDRHFSADARAAKAAAQAAAAASVAKPEGYGVEERGKRKAGQLRMFNPPPRQATAAKPSGALVVLGHLTEIVTRGPTEQPSAWRWALRSAPLLAYDTAGRLFVVYPSRKVGRASEASRKSYSRTHWGQAGKGDELDGAIVVGKAKVLGVGVSVTYTTQKGADAAPVDYVHEWGEGARGSWTPPLVCHNDRGDRVAFAGGTYRVTERGIVG